MSDDGHELTIADLNEALADMLREGLIETFVNEDGQQVFRLTDKGLAKSVDEFL